MLQGLIDTISGDNNATGNFKISIPTPSSTQLSKKKKVSYNIKSFQREPNQKEKAIFVSSTPTTVTFASTTTTRSTTRTTRSSSAATATAKPERLLEERRWPPPPQPKGEEGKLIPGQRLIKNSDGSIRVEDGGFIKEELNGIHKEEKEEEQWVIRPLSKEERKEPIPFLEVDKQRRPTPIDDIAKSRLTGTSTEKETSVEATGAELKVLFNTLELLLYVRIILLYKTISYTL